MLAALAATLVALLPFPLRAAALWSRRGALGARRAAGCRRPLFGEPAVLAVTAPALAEVRRRCPRPGARLAPLPPPAPFLLPRPGSLPPPPTAPLALG
ncbi:hypothetical protein VM98_36885, partial [Streptomyces rubellomurinus subsp. indigoferus]